VISQDKELVINTLEDIYKYINLSSLLEVSGWPKPGNIHRTRNFKDTRFEHFLVSITAVQTHFREFCKNVYKYSINIGEDYSFVKLGYLYREAAKTMMKSQKGGNTIFGHILILAPLAAAAAICLKSEAKKFKNFIFNVKKIIKDATVVDTVNLYQAILLCDVGGLGKVDEYDVYDKDSIKLIKKDKVSLKKIFQNSQDYDLISSEYANDFNIILQEGLPYFLEQFDKSNDINVAIVNAYLKILADYPDTLIIRKSGVEMAQAVSNNAQAIIARGGILTEEGLNLAWKLDTMIQEKEGKANPGTTADIVTGVIFCALLLGLKF